MTLLRPRPVTSFGHQGEQRAFRGLPKFLKRCPTYFSKKALPPLVTGLLRPTPCLQKAELYGFMFFLRGP